MLGVRYSSPLQPCSLFPSMYHDIDKPYGITISLPPYSNMFVVLTYLKSLVEICDFVTNEFATSYDYLTFTTTVGYIYNYCLHLKPLATTL